MDGQRSHTVEDDAIGTQYFRDQVHIKPIPGYAPTPPKAKIFSERREEGAPMPVEISNTKAMASPPKPKPETPMKQQADNPSDNVQAS